MLQSTSFARCYITQALDAPTVTMPAVIRASCTLLCVAGAVAACVAHVADLTPAFSIKSKHIGVWTTAITLHTLRLSDRLFCWCFRAQSLSVNGRNRPPLRERLQKCSVLVSSVLREKKCVRTCAQYVQVHRIRIFLCTCILSLFLVLYRCCRAHWRARTHTHTHTRYAL